MSENTTILNSFANEPPKATKAEENSIKQLSSFKNYVSPKVPPMTAANFVPPTLKFTTAIKGTLLDISNA